MKKKSLSLFMAVCVFSAFPGALGCQCVDADCGSVPKAIQAETLRCHSAASHAKGEDPSRKECCGKCRIEKAAVLSKEFSPVNPSRTRPVTIEEGFLNSFYPEVPRPFFSHEQLFGPSPGFFKRYVLNITFSFRAPPAAVPF